MTGEIIVQCSPTKPLQVYNRIQQQRAKEQQESFYRSFSTSYASSDAEKRSSASTSIAASLPSFRVSNFLTSSAQANRAADAKIRKKPHQKKIYRREQNSDFTCDASTSSSTTDARDESLRLREHLLLGPKKVAPLPDDPHFLNLEPTSGIALIRRRIPHQEFEAHLDNRYYIPISKLYSVAELGKSDDGDYTIPVEGDWLTMGVVIRRSETRFTEAIEFDAMGRRLDKNGKPVRDEAPFFAKDKDQRTSHSDKPLVEGTGATKRIQERHFFILTLLDLSHRPDQYGQQAGSQEIELAVFEADSHYVDSDGVRQYGGGSCGAYERLLTTPNGTLVCALNPRVKKPYTKRDKSNKVLRLNPRSGRTIMLVGTARDYGHCIVGRCQEFVDKRETTKQCQRHLYYDFEKAQNARPQLYNSFTPGTAFNATDALMGPKSKNYIFDRGNKNLKRNPDALVDTDAHFVRSQEEEDPAGKARATALVELNKKLHAKRVGPLISEADSEKQMAQQARSKWIADVGLRELMKRREDSSPGAQGKADGIVGSHMLNYDSSGSQALEAARKAMQERTRLAYLAASTKKRGMDAQADKVDGAKRSKANDALQPDNLPAGTYQSSKGEIRSLSSSSSQLLARHNTRSAELPKPMLRRKKAKLPPTVRPPPGESFYASESSDDELDEIMKSEHIRVQLDATKFSLAQGVVQQSGSDSDSDDLEILPRSSQV